jgi:hypothetical protein
LPTLIWTCSEEGYKDMILSAAYIYHSSLKLINKYLTTKFIALIHLLGNTDVDKINTKRLSSV